MKFLAIIGGTIREGFARKTILGMFIVSTACIIIAVLLFQLNAVQSGLLAPPKVQVQHGSNVTTQQFAGLTVLDGVWTGISMMLLLLCVFVGTFVTASFVTSLMEKGTIDLYLSKPVPRWQYIVGRYTGGVLIISAEVAYLIIGLWIAAGLSLGAWNPAFLWSILFITVAFAGIYSLVTLFGVLTRSSWFAAIIALAIYILGAVIIPLGLFLDRLLNGFSTEGILTSVAKGIKYTIPSNSLGNSLAHILVNKPADLAPLFITLGLIAIYVSLSSFAFSRKEF